MGFSFLSADVADTRSAYLCGGEMGRERGGGRERRLERRRFLVHLEVCFSAPGSPFQCGLKSVHCIRKAQPTFCQILQHVAAPDLKRKSRGATFLLLRYREEMRCSL